jgi:hypothetical protein
MRRLVPAVAVLAAALAAPGAASAASARIAGESIQDDTCRYLPEECALVILEYEAAAGERNDVSFEFDPSAESGYAATVRDAGAVIEPGAGCERVDEHTARCRPGSPLDEVRVRAGDGDDSVSSTGRSTLLGGAGDDRLTLTGASLGHFNGGPGSDTMTGGDGTDFFDGGPDSESSDPDVIDGGGDNDLVDYGERRRGVTIDLSGASRSGARAEGDVIRDVESGWGGSGGDTLLGTDDADHFDGNAGDDLVMTGPGRDVLDGGRGGDGLFSGDDADFLYGGAGRDRLSAGVGRDRLFGGAGSDRLAGGDDADRLRGNTGRDRLLGGTGEDLFSGGRGGDLLLARDGEADSGSGGTGRDRALVDPNRDRFTRVERLLGGL